MTDRAALLELVDGYLEGTLRGDALATLERHLRAEADACRLFWIAVNHEIQLRQHPFSATTTLPAAATQVRPPMSWWRRPRLVLAACAALLLGTVGWGLLHRLGNAAVLARIADVHAPTGDAGRLHHSDQRSEPLRAGLEIRAGERLAVAIGAGLELRLSGEDTVLSLGSRTTLTLHDRAAGVLVRLESGSLNAVVAHQAPSRRLSVATQHATLDVIGTRFAATADATRTSVEVDEGRVRVVDGAAGSLEIGPGQSMVAETGKTLAIARLPDLRWNDRRPLGVMMLCRDQAGWRSNPRGWLGEAKIDVTTPAGLADFHHRLDTVIDHTIANLHEVGAQGVVFWDLEGPGYVGDPRQLADLAPEMAVVADAMFARLRAAGFAVGVVVRTEAADHPASGGLVLRRVDDPVREVQAKIAYAQQRWGATIFPVLGDGGNALTMTTICRRVSAASPGVLLIPTGADADTWRWGAPWYLPTQPAPEVTAESARLTLPNAFAVIAPLETAYLQQNRAALVTMVAAGDVLTFRAWHRSDGTLAVQSIYAEAKP